MTYNRHEVSSAVFSYGYKIDGVFGRVAEEDNGEVVPVYKLRQPVSGDRLFTTSATERALAMSTYGYDDEGIGFYAATTQSTGNNNQYIPVYRLQNGAFHYYAFGQVERDSIDSISGWTLESDRTFYIQPAKMY